ncbi:MAG TPA: succinate dehydrogenase, hydrophobic membrane anchor protein [Wenzhouxiangella sp.]|nr:succinate dehydrogenase, hydrophobic membrane anchor protein [Wenzhouxiangella sp.]
MSEFRHPLKKAMGHGSAGDGVGHWWAQRFSALLLIGLTVWLIWALTRLAGADHGSAAAFLGSPFNATMAILFMVAGFYHGQLGLQVIIEDYVHRRAAEVALIVIVKALALFGAVLSVLAVLKLALGV